MVDIKNEERSWSERAGRIFCFLCIILGIYLIFKYLLYVFLPFLIAWALALITRPAARWLTRVWRAPRRLCAFIVTLIFICGIFGLLYLFADRLVYESERLLMRLSEDSELLGGAVAGFIDRLSSIGDRKLPIIENLMKIEAFREFWENIDVTVSKAVGEAVSSITKMIPTMIFDVLGKMPGAVIFIIITLISCFYFADDVDRINRFAVSLLPKGWQEKVPDIKRNFLKKAGKYVRAYVLLLILTFGELLAGFYILRVPYPFLLAIFIALLDILPVLGVGTALIPWALAEILLFRDYFTGIGLFIVYAIITVVRQVTEPKLVAGSLGLHPLLTLVSMYVGLKLFGIFGMVLGPAVLTVLSALSDRTVDKPTTV